MNATGPPSLFRHDCRRHDCWLHLNQPRFEFFADCFPGLNNMTDRDGSIERKGYYLLIEFKSRRRLPLGQRLYLEHQPPEYFVAVAVCPDCTTMEITELAVRSQDDFKLGEFQPSSLQTLRTLMRRWWQWADSQEPTAAAHEPAP